MSDRQQSKKARKSDNFSFPVYLHGSSSDKAKIFQQMDQIRAMIKPGCRTTNLEIMDKVLNFWILHHTNVDQGAGESSVSQQKEPHSDIPPNFIMLDSSQSESESTHLIGATALNNLLQKYNHHGKHCTGNLVMDTNNIAISGFWNRFMLSCTKTTCTVYGSEKLKWCNSAYISPTGSFINQRMLHATQTSGMLPSQLENFCELANISCGITKFMRPSSATCDRYISSVTQVRQNLSPCTIEP